MPAPSAVIGPREYLGIGLCSRLPICKGLFRKYSVPTQAQKLPFPCGLMGFSLWVDESPPNDNAGSSSSDKGRELRAALTGRLRRPPLPQGKESIRAEVSCYALVLSP